MAVLTVKPLINVQSAVMLRPGSVPAESIQTRFRTPVPKLSDKRAAELRLTLR